MPKQESFRDPGGFGQFAGRRAGEAPAREQRTAVSTMAWRRSSLSSLVTAMRRQSKRLLTSIQGTFPRDASKQNGASL